MHKDPTRRYQSVQEMVEAVFGAELITGWIGDESHLSPLTVASLSDLGYGLAPRGVWAVDAAYA